MINVIVNTIGVKMGRRTLVNREELAKILGYKLSTFKSKLSKGEIPKASKVETASGEMFDLNIALSVK